MENNNENNEQTQPQTVGNDYNINPDTTVEIPSVNLFSGITVIGIGQGGSQVGLLLENKLRKMTNYSKMISINTAKADLDAIDIPKERKYLIGDGSGAGKNRAFSKKLFWENDDIFNKIIEENKKLFFGTNQVILVVFSANGGTGSGIANKLIAKLSQFCANTTENYTVVRNGKKEAVSIDPYRPNVIGVCITPDITSALESGVDSLENTLECMTEIDTLIKNKIASYFIVKNKLCNDKNVYAKTNENILNGFEKFFKLLGTSNENTILDSKDRFSALSLPGLMAFSTLEDIDKYGMLTPAHGAKVPMLLAELSYSSNEEYQSKLKIFEKFVRNYNLSDTTLGWNDINLVSESNRTELVKSDLVLFAGFSNIETIMEPMKEVLDRKRRALDNVNIQGNAFDGLKEAVEERMAEKRKNTSADIDIDNLI